MEMILPILCSNFGFLLWYDLNYYYETREFFPYKKWALAYVF